MHRLWPLSRHGTDGQSGDTAATTNWLMLACTPTTFCCTYTSSFNDPSCCNDSSRVFDAGAASYGGGASFITQQKPSTTATRPSSTSATTLITSLVSVLATPTPTNGQSDAGLTTGVKAGIGIGAALGIIALVGLAVFAVLRSRKAKAREGFAVTELTVEPKEMESSGYRSSRQCNEPVEVEGSEVKRHLLAELPGKRQRAELQGN